jgi:hypothetical protein
MVVAGLGAGQRIGLYRIGGKHRRNSLRGLRGRRCGNLYRHTGTDRFGD